MLRHCWAVNGYTVKSDFLNVGLLTWGAHHIQANSVKRHGSFPKALKYIRETESHNEMRISKSLLKKLEIVQLIVIANVFWVLTSLNPDNNLLRQPLLILFYRWRSWILERSALSRGPVCLACGSTCFRASHLGLQSMPCHLQTMWLWAVL